MILSLWVSADAHPSANAADPRRDPEEVYVTGLRARRLYALAEQHCLRRLADPALSDADRVALTIQLSQCFAEHATERAGQEQAELWKRARNVVTELLEANPDIRERELLILQSAYVPAAQGAALRWQSTLAPHDDARRQLAIVQLQDACSALRAAEAALEADVRTPHLEFTVSPARLRLLVVDARFFLARCQVDLAELLPSGLDRTSALHAAETRLTDLARSAVNNSRRFESRLLLARAARLRGDHSEAMRILDALVTGDVPQELRQQAIAESMRVELSRGRPAAALDQLQEAEQAGDPVSDEVLCVGVEARVAARLEAQAENNLARAERLWDAASRAADGVRGPWRARSMALLEGARSSDEFGPAVAPLVLAARSAQQNGDLQRAISAYGQAIAYAGESGRRELAATLQYSRGSLLVQAEDYAAAASDFLGVAAGDVPVTRAAEAHLMAAYCRGKQWESLPTQANREAYAAMLAEHRSRFEEQPTWTEATWMLAAYQESRLQWTEALALYGAIPLTHPRAEAARARIALLYEQILRRLRTTGEPREAWEDRAVEQLLEYIELMPLPPSPLSAADSQVALSFGRIVLNHRDPDYDDADALLGRVITSARLVMRQAETQDASAVDPVWPQFEQTAESLRIVSLAGQGKIADARQLLGTLTAGDPGAALTVLDGLAEVARNSRPDQRIMLGKLQVQAAEEVQRRGDELTPRQSQRLAGCLAEAYASVGRPDDAVQTFRRMLEVAPADKGLIARAAGGIAAIGSPASVREAKTLWRRVEKLEAPGSAEWLSARLEVARCCRQLEQIEEFRKLLGVTRVLYPELGGPELKRQFDELEASLDD